MVTRDIKCNSKFMTDSMREVGIAIRSKFNLIAGKDAIIHLFMDNAGGHGRTNI